MNVVICPRCGKKHCPSYYHRYKDKHGYYCSWHCYNHRLDGALLKKVHRNRKTVYQYNKKSGEFIAEYESARQAAVKLGLNAERITACCRGETKSAQGFIWKWKEDVEEWQKCDKTKLNKKD